MDVVDHEKYEYLPRNYIKKKKNPFKIPMKTRPHYENEDYVFLVTLGKVLKPYVSVSSTVKWGNTCLSGL